MPAELVIRPAERGDEEIVLALVRELADFEKLAHEVVASAAGLAQGLFGANPAAEALIGELDGKAVGYALFFRNFSTFLGRPGLYLEDLYISPDFRRRGFGRQFLVRLAQIAVERGYGRFEWSVLDWNERAIRTYRNIGAEPMDEWTVYRLSGAALEQLAASGAVDAG